MILSYFSAEMYDVLPAISSFAFLNFSKLLHQLTFLSWSHAGKNIFSIIISIYTKNYDPNFIVPFLKQAFFKGDSLINKKMKKTCICK